jgi:hypothetical protein
MDPERRLKGRNGGAASGRPIAEVTSANDFATGAKLIKGQAADDRELFEFTVEPFVTGGFMSIRYSGDGANNVTGAGVWPSVEKAEEVAEQSARRLLHGAAVTWQE